MRTTHTPQWLFRSLKSGPDNEPNEHQKIKEMERKANEPFKERPTIPGGPREITFVPAGNFQIVSRVI